MGTGASKTTKQQKAVKQLSFIDKYPDNNPRGKSWEDNSSYGGYSATPDNDSISPGTQHGYISMEEDEYPIPGSVCDAWWTQTDSHECSFPEENSRHASRRSSRPVNDVTTIHAFGNVYDSDSCKDMRSASAHDFTAAVKVKGINKSAGPRRSLTRKASYIDTDRRSPTSIDTRDPVNRPKAAKRSRSSSRIPEKNNNSDTNTFTNFTTRDGSYEGGERGVSDGDKEEVVDLVQLVTRLLRENQAVSGTSNDSEGTCMNYCEPKTKFTVKVSVKPNSQVCEIILPEAMLFLDNRPTIARDSK